MKPVRIDRCILHLLFLITILTACGNETSETKAERKIEDWSNTVYVSSYLELDTGDGQVLESTMGESYLYLLCDQDVDGQLRSCLFRLPLDGGKSEPLAAYESVAIPEGAEGSAYAAGLALGADGSLWVREMATYHIYELPEDFDEETQSKQDYRMDGGSWDILRQLDEHGAEQRQIDLAAVLEELGYNRQTLLDRMQKDSPMHYLTDGFRGGLLDFAWDEAGGLWLLSLGTLYVLDSDLNLRFTLEWDGVYGSLLSLSGGFALAAYEKENDSGTLTGLTVRPVDSEAGKWGEAYPIASDALAAWSGMGRWDFFYTTADSLYAWKEGTATRLTAWDQGRVQPSLLQCCAMLPNGHIAALLDRNGQPEVTILSELGDEPQPQVTTLIYAALDPNYVDYDAVNDFNRTHTDVQIKVKDYSVYVTDTAPNGAVDQLLLEIGEGKLPDIVDLGRRDSRLHQTLARLGYLEDLYPWIENDPDLGRDALMEAPLKAAEVDGKLYMAFGAVEIVSLVGPARLVRERITWTLTDLQEAYAVMPEGATLLECYTGKEDLFRDLFRLSLDSFVDWETGRCSFDSDSFRCALELINRFPSEQPYYETAADGEVEQVVLDMQNGMQLLTRVYMSDLFQVQIMDAAFGEQTSFVGYPREDGSVGSAFRINGANLAMLSTCRDKEAAWEIIRKIYLPHTDGELKLEPAEGVGNVNWVTGIPVNCADFERQRDHYMEKGTDVKYGYFGLMIDIHPVTEEEYQRFFNLYNHITAFDFRDFTIYDLVWELCQPYFAGDRSLDETVRLIQNQVGLYVSEQMR